MKKITMTAIYDALVNYGYDNEEVLNELKKDINKGEEAKAKTAAAYDAIHDIIIDNLDFAPMTCADLFEKIKDELPEGNTKGKVQYALTHLWQNEIVKIEGKPNSYRRA